MFGEQRPLTREKEPVFKLKKLLFFEPMLSTESKANDMLYSWLHGDQHTFSSHVRILLLEDNVEELL